MSENNEGRAFAAASSGKSPEEIAFELVNKLKGQGVWGERNMAAILDMYAECLDAAKGLRSYAGQNRVDLPTKIPGATTRDVQEQRADEAAQRLAAAQRQMQPQPAQQSALIPPTPAQPQPTIQAQQQALQQAYKPG